MFQHKTKFVSSARLLLEENISQLTSFASLQDLKSAIPDSLSKNESLVPFAGNLVLVGVANGNGHLIDTETALSHYKLFEHTRCDIEHSVSESCGHIVSVFLTEFDEDYKIGEGSKILKEKDVQGINTPFNIAVVGVLYKGSIPNAINKIIDSSDPKSDEYMKISLSWEVGYNDSNILLGNSVQHGKIISDEKEKLKYQNYLKDSNGSGRLKDGTPVNKLIIGSITPLGLGLTYNPASPVKGIVVPDKILGEYKEIESEEENIEAKHMKHTYGECPECGDDEHDDTMEEDNMITCGACKKKSKAKMWKKKDEDIIAAANQSNIAAQLENIDKMFAESSEKLKGFTSELFAIAKNNEKSENNISHLEKGSVIHNDNEIIVKDNNKNITQKTYIKMKFIESLASLEKVTDEDLQKGEVSVANVLQVVKDGIKQANDKYVTELNAEKTAVAAAQKESEDAKKAALEAKASADKAQEKITALETTLANQEAEQKFQLRMGGLDDKYELDDEYRAVVASDLKGLSDEDFDKYAKKFAVIAKHLNKETIAASKAKETKTEKKDVKEVVKAALDNAEIEKETVPNAPAVNEDVKAKLKNAFSKVVVK